MPKTVDVSLTFGQLREVARDAIREIREVVEGYNFEDPSDDWTPAGLRQVQRELDASFARAVELVQTVEAFAPGATLASDEQETEDLARIE